MINEYVNLATLLQKATLHQPGNLTYCTGTLQIHGQNTFQLWSQQTDTSTMNSKEPTPFSAVAVAKYGDRASKKSSRVRGKNQQNQKKPTTNKTPKFHAAFRALKTCYIKITYYHFLNSFCSQRAFSLSPYLQANGMC